MAEETDAVNPMRDRILRATFKVLCRNGYGKFNLSDVAAQAGISRPTLYKSFPSKHELLSAFSEFEVQLLSVELHRAVDGHTGRRRLHQLLEFLAEFYRSYPMRGLVEIEPGLVLAQLSQALPVLVDLISPVLAGEVSEPETVAMALARLSLCHYLVPGYDENRLLDQLRAAAGVR